MQSRRTIPTASPKVTYALQTCAGGIWRTDETFDSAVRAVAKYGSATGRRRVLAISFDTQHRQHNAVLRDSEEDERIDDIVTRKLAPVPVTAERDWAEDDNGEPLRVPPHKGVYWHAQAR